MGRVRERLLLRLLLCPALLVELALLGLTPVAHAVDIGDLTGLSSEQALYDPILYKAWLAAKFTAAAANSSGCPTDVECTGNVTLVYGSTKAVLTSTNTYSLVVTFFSNDANLASRQSKQGLTTNNTTQFSEINYADYIVTGNQAAQAQASTFEAFRTGAGVTTGQSLTAAVQSLKLKVNGGTPVNVLITGEKVGASLAPLAALYLAVTYPIAHISVITFGMTTWPLNNKANWTLTQLTDYYYFFPSTLVEYPQLASATVADLVAMKSSKLAKEVRQLLIDSRVVQIFDDNGTDVTSLNLPTTPLNETASPIINANKTEADYGPGRLNETIDTWNRVKDECPPVFCKIRFPSVLQALIYEEYYPETPDVHGPVRIGEVFDEYGPIQLVLSAGRDADGAVGWIPERETAYFIFRGSESDRDWHADANAAQAYYKTKSDAQKVVFENPQAHAGVYRQFEKLTFKPDKPEDDFEVVLKNISGGAQPRVIVCTGQSLGGGLSHMCGPWASNTWPNASVFVVNEGSLKPGDADWIVFFNSIAGNAYRMVNGKDQVPLLSPFSNYHHAFRGWWLDNSTTAGPMLLAGERDPLPLLESNWVDHSYYTYSILQMTINNVTAPDWVQQLDNTTYFESYKGADKVMGQPVLSVLLILAAVHLLCLVLI